MRKILIVFIAVTLTLFFVAGCTTPPVEEIQNIEAWVTGFEQEVRCDNTKDVMRSLNGELPIELLKCCPPPCPPCPPCDSCCEECEECEICPTCSPCCCYLKWGKNILVDFEMRNFGAVDLTVQKICFKINFEDDTEIKKCIELEEMLLAGDDKECQAEILLDSAKRVVYVEISEIGYY